MLWLRIIGAIVRTLKDGATPAQIALGFVLGWAFGLIPGWPVQVWLVVLLLIVLQANLSMAIVGALLAGALAWLLDPLIDGLGYAVLRAEALRGVFTTLYNSPPWALTRFNNTVVMGAMVTALLGGIALFPVLVAGVRWYRGYLLQRMHRFRVVQAFQGSRIHGFYRRLQELGLV